jgi:hypothetical protein
MADELWIFTDRGDERVDWTDMSPDLMRSLGLSDDPLDHDPFSRLFPPGTVLPSIRTEPSILAPDGAIDLEAVAQLRARAIADKNQQFLDLLTAAERVPVGDQAATQPTAPDDEESTASGGPSTAKAVMAAAKSPVLYRPNFDIKFPKGFLPGGTPPDFVPLDELQKLKDEAYNRWQFYQHLIDSPLDSAFTRQVDRTTFHAQADQWQKIFETVDALLIKEKLPASEVAEFLSENSGKVIYGPNPSDFGSIGPGGGGSSPGYDEYIISRPAVQTLVNSAQTALNGNPGPVTPSSDGVDDSTGYVTPSPRKNIMKAENPGRATNQIGDAIGNAAPSAVETGLDVLTEVISGGKVVAKTWTSNGMNGILVVDPHTGQALTGYQARNILHSWANVPDKDLPPDPADK